MVGSNWCSWSLRIWGKYDDNSVEVFPDRMLVKNHPIELPVGDILHCNGELGINLAPAEGKYFTWCDPLYLVLKSEISSLASTVENLSFGTALKIRCVLE